MNYTKRILTLILSVISLITFLNINKTSAASVYEEDGYSDFIISSTEASYNGCDYYSSFVYNDGNRFTKERIVETDEMSFSHIGTKPVYSIVYKATPEYYDYSTTLRVDENSPRVSVSIGSSSECSFESSVSSSVEVSTGVSYSVGASLSASCSTTLQEETTFDFELDVDTSCEYGLYMNYYQTKYIEITYTPREVKTGWWWWQIKYHTEYDMSTTFKIYTIVSDVYVYFEEV